MSFGTNLSQDSRNLCVIIEPACIELTGSLRYHYCNYDRRAVDKIKLDFTADKEKNTGINKAPQEWRNVSVSN